MIRYADNTDKQLVWNMWKTCFGDSDDYMDIYFRRKYKNENTLIYFHEGKAVSSLQMLPFNLTFHDTEIPIAYLSGLCTLPDARKKGFMAALIEKSFDEMGKKGACLGILVPQDESLFKFYEPFGFIQTFDLGAPLPNLQQILSASSDINHAYQRFDSFFRSRDMTVQKTFDDFVAIVEEAKLFGYPSKKSLIGMSRIINVENLLWLFTKKYPSKTFSLQITDTLLEQNNGFFVIDQGKVSKKYTKQHLHFSLDIKQLTQFLLGYSLPDFQEDLQHIFSKKEPLIAYMME